MYNLGAWLGQFVRFAQHQVYVIWNVTVRKREIPMYWVDEFILATYNRWRLACIKSIRQGQR